MLRRRRDSVVRPPLSRVMRVLQHLFGKVTSLQEQHPRGRPSASSRLRRRHRGRDPRTPGYLRHAPSGYLKLCNEKIRAHEPKGNNIT